MKNFLLPLLAAVTLPTSAVAHPLPHGQGGPLEAINHSVVSKQSEAANHGTPKPGDPKTCCINASAPPVMGEICVPCKDIGK